MDIGREVADLTPKLGFAEALLESDRIVALDQPDPECGRYKILG